MADATPDDEREAMRATFESAAGTYETARPDYPPELFDALVRRAHLAPGDTLLEIGCATGKATRPLAERGFRIVCIELGADLVDAARLNLYWSAAHVFPDDGDAFFREIQQVYEEIGEGLPSDAPWPKPGELDDDRVELEASGRFSDVAVEHFDWEVVYDAGGYLALLDTFSGHIAMESWQRARLYDEIELRIGARADGRVRRHWGAVLHVARRVG